MFGPTGPTVATGSVASGSHRAAGAEIPPQTSGLGGKDLQEDTGLDARCPLGHMGIGNKGGERR